MPRSLIAASDEQEMIWSGNDTVKVHDDQIMPIIDGAHILAINANPVSWPQSLLTMK
jgi:hypothetical protein